MTAGWTGNLTEAYTSLLKGEKLPNERGDALVGAGLAAPSVETRRGVRAVGPHAAFRGEFDEAVAEAGEALARVMDLHAQVSDFTDHYVARLRRDRAEDVHLLEGADQIVTAVHEFVATARTSVWAMMSWSVLVDTAAQGWEDAVSLAAGRLDLRVVCPVGGARDRLGTYLEGLSAAGAQVRVVGFVPATCVVVDGDVAVIVNGEKDPASRSAYVIRSPDLVRLVMYLFEHGWASGRPTGTAARWGISEAERRLLEELAAGHKDEAIARRIGVSVRTLRRTITGLAARAGVSSRFALALEAQRRGWLLGVDGPGIDSLERPPLRALDVDPEAASPR